jgi:hypothetical protein
LDVLAHLSHPFPGGALNPLNEVMNLRITLIKAGKMVSLCAATVVLLELFVFLGPASAQEDVASAIRRYKEREFSTGYYEEYEAKPFRSRPLVGVSAVKTKPFPYTSTGAQIRVRSRLADSHRAIKFYENLKCEYCHMKETKDVHTVLANLTCRQCHGGEPIASIDHFYSPLNPIRKHAYVCAKCHEGAGASFADYVVHEPDAGSSTTRTSFPALYYSYWFMIFLLGATLAFFVPHTAMVIARELFKKKEKGEVEASDAH